MNGQARVLLVVLCGVALTVRYTELPAKHKIILTSQDRMFEFVVDELPDGRHYFKAHLGSYYWLLQSQDESGILAEKDWTTLQGLQRLSVLPKDGSPQLEEPDEIWGALQRGNEKIVLRYAEWWKIGGTQVYESYVSFVHKQKASL